MGSYSSLGTTFDIPNYTGDIFGISPTETPLLSMIGGLNGGKAIQGKSWEWQTYDLKIGTPGERRLPDTRDTLGKMDFTQAGATTEEMPGHLG